MDGQASRAWRARTAAHATQAQAAGAHSLYLVNRVILLGNLCGKRCLHGGGVLRGSRSDALQRTKNKIYKHRGMEWLQAAGEGRACGGWERAGGVRWA